MTAPPPTPPWNGSPTPYGAPYAPPAPPVAARPDATLGIVAMVLGLLAAVAAPLAAGIALAQIAAGIDTTSTSLAAFTPVREWVLVAEVAFWAGTALGTWALAQGIVAAVTARGRAAGIVGIIAGAAGPVLFLFAVTMGGALGVLPTLGI